MSKSDDFQDNPIDAVLRADAQSHDTSPLREAALSRTLATIRFRRRMRRCVMAASLAGCYVAGLATVAIQRPTVHEAALPSAVSSLSSGANGLQNHKNGSAKLTRAEIVRRDADRCLLDRGDVKEAVRHYDMFLELASADHRAIAPEQDSWLLMALKDARLKESTHDSEKQD